MAIKDVLVGAPIIVTGGVLLAPKGTALPTDHKTALDAGFKASGYVSEEGLSMTENRQTQKIKAWGGSTVRELQTEHDVTFSWAWLETNGEVLKAVYGTDNVSETAATATDGTIYAVQIKGEQLKPVPYTFEMKDGDARIRVVVPDLQITETGETKFVHDDVIRYNVTATALPDDNGVKAYMYMTDGVTSA